MNATQLLKDWLLKNKVNAYQLDERIHHMLNLMVLNNDIKGLNVIFNVSIKDLNDVELSAQEVLIKSKVLQFVESLYEVAQENINKLFNDSNYECGVDKEGNIVFFNQEANIKV